jgi:hypothetical protein
VSKESGNKKRLYSEEIKSIGNNKRDERTAEHHGETERQKRKAKQSQVPSSAPWRLKRK